MTRVFENIPAKNVSKQPENRVLDNEGDIFRLILENSADPVCLIDRDNRFVYCNAAFEDFASLSKKQILTRNMEAIVRAPPTFMQALLNVRENQQSGIVDEVTFFLNKRSSGDFSVHLSPVYERPGWVVIVFRGRLHTREIGQYEGQKNALRSASFLAELLAHEIKNPLAGIRGAAQLLESDARPEDIRMLQLIRSESDRLTSLLNSLEIFTDPRPITKQVENIHEILDYAVQIAKSAKRTTASYQIDYDPSLPKILANRDLLVQALLNLLGNADDALPENGGMIEISTQYHSGLRINSSQGKKQTALALPLAIKIKDNGKGIAQDLQRHLFEPFVSDKLSGKGLGLAIVAKVIEAHQGFIEFESDEKGTTFTLLFPTAQDVTAE